MYSDASWLTKNSVSGGLILFWGIPAAWWSRLQKSVSASTAEAECYAAALASREGVYTRDFAEENKFPVTRPTPLYLDSKAALDLANDPVAFKKTKHILRHSYELRDRVARRVYSPVFVDTHSQLADVLTKGLRVAQHQLVLQTLLPEGANRSTSTDIAVSDLPPEGDAHRDGSQEGALEPLTGHEEPG